jgi:hypothetical protein
MSIRQHRLNTEALIRSRIADFKGKKININEQNIGAGEIEVSR